MFGYIYAYRCRVEGRKENKKSTQKNVPLSRPSKTVEQWIAFQLKNGFVFAISGLWLTNVAGLNYVLREWVSECYGCTNHRKSGQKARRHPSTDIATYIPDRSYTFCPGISGNRRKLVVDLLFIYGRSSALLIPSDLILLVQ
jgi:hypothetical protein